MDLNEQEKGILIGVALTVIAFYAFNFFSSPQTSSEIVEQQENFEQTHADRFLQEPLGLYTGVEKTEDGKSTRLKNKKEEKKLLKEKKINRVTKMLPYQ